MGGDGVGVGGTKEERALDRVRCRLAGCRRAHGSASSPRRRPAHCAEQAPVKTQRVVVHRVRGRELGGHGHGGGSW